ncbi:MAG: hypothetical protein ABI664_09345 [bacterium]
MMPNFSTDNRPGRKPIRSVVAVGVIFLAIGALDVYRGVDPLLVSGKALHLASDDLLVLAIGVIALIAGVFVLRGRNWARWVLAGWMAVHVVISASELPALGMHLLIFGFMTFLLFRPRASSWFGPAVRSASEKH